MRKILKITEEEVRMIDLKKGDLFRILPDGVKDTYVDGNKTWVALGDGYSAPNEKGTVVGTVECDEISYNRKRTEVV